MSTGNTVLSHGSISTRRFLQPSWLSTESYGLVLLVVSAVLFSVMGTFLKLASNTGLPSTQLVFCRAVFQGSIFLLAMLFCKAETTAQGSVSSPLIVHPFGGTPEVQKIVVARGAIGGMGFMFYFYTLSALPLGDAIATLSLYPIATVFFARIFLGEPIQLLHVLVAIACVVGTIFIASPSFLFDNDEESSSQVHQHNSLGYVTGVLGSCFASGVVTLIRKAGMVGAHTLQLLFSWATFGILFSILFGLVSNLSAHGHTNWHLPPSTTSWLYVLAMCALGSAAHFFLNYAGRLAPAGLAAIARSSDIMWAYLLEAFIFHQKPTSRTYVGVLLVCLSIAAIAVQKVREEREAAAATIIPEKVPTDDEDEEDIEMGTPQESTSIRINSPNYTKVSNSERESSEESIE